MIEVNEPQVWTLIGVFAATLVGTITFMSTMLLRVIDAKFEAFGSRFEAVERRFDAMDRRFDHLDRDIQAMARRVFPETD